LFEILLIDRLNHHQFQPLFYQVATSQLEPTSISFPLRKLFRNRKNTQIRLATVLKVHPEAKTVSTTIGDFPYDFLIIATGCKTNFFGNSNLEKYTYGLKTTYDAIKIRNTILGNFEALLSATQAEKEYLLNIVIVGAGPTGVELAGSFAEIKRKILPKDFNAADVKRIRIILLEGSANTLGNMSELARSASMGYLKSMGVEVVTKVFVKDYDGGTVLLSNGDIIKSRQVIWTAGVTGNLIEGLQEDVLMPGNRIKVDRFNLAEGCSDIYAVGDIAYMETPNYPNGHPQVANVAINQAKNLARNLKALILGKPMAAYEYTNLGAMATIGRNKAVVDLPFYSFKGRLAWFTWMFLHLMLILSVRNKLIIFINWAWNYFTGDTSLRLILKDKD
jgi:NADH dehydrogenase